MEINMQQAIAEVRKSRVRYVWKMDEETYKACTKLKDDRGSYAWLPDLSSVSSSPGTFLGYPIVIVEEQSFQLTIVIPPNVTFVVG